VTDYQTGGGATVHTVQTGTTNIVFIDRVGKMVLGTYSPYNRPRIRPRPRPPITRLHCVHRRQYDHLDGWQTRRHRGLDENDVLPRRRSPSPIYTNQNGVPVHLVSKRHECVCHRGWLGKHSLGHFLTATTGVADSYPSDVATFSGTIQSGSGKLTWSDGVYVWTQTGNPRC